MVTYVTRGSVDSTAVFYSFFVVHTGFGEPIAFHMSVDTGHPSHLNNVYAEPHEAQVNCTKYQFTSSASFLTVNCECVNTAVYEEQR